MKVNQVANILNTVFSEVIGETAQVAEDLSNIVDVGRTITSSSEYGNNINGYLKSVWDKIGWTMYVDQDYRSSAPDIYVTDAEFGSVLEKIRVIPEEYEDNKAWTFTPEDSSSFEDLFGYHPAEVSAKYWNSVDVYRTKPLTITEKQFTSAFLDRNEMMRFIGVLQNTYITKFRMAYDYLIRRTISGLIAEKIKANNGVINFLQMYNLTHTTKLTATNALQDSDFLKWAGATFKMYLDYLKEPTVLYNTDGYVNITNREDMKVVMLTDFVRSMETYLYADTFNPEYLELDGYDVVPYWQSGGTDNAYVTRSSINVVPPSSTDKTPIVQSGIVAVVFDKRACMVNAHRPETGVQHNDFDKWDNYIWQSQAGHYIDTGENCIVFIIADTTPTPDPEET